MFRHTTPILCAILLAFMTGCSPEAPPEQKIADSSFEKAQSARLNGAYAQSRKLLNLSIALDKALGRTARVAEAQKILGDLHAAGAAFDSATLYYGQAAASYRAIAERPMVRDITRALAALQHQQGDDRQAFATYVELLRLTRVFGDTTGVHLIEWDMLPICRRLDERDPGRRILDELTTWYAQARDQAGRARVQWAMGAANYARRRNDLGATDFAGAFALALQGRDSTLAVTALADHARALEKVGRSSDAVGLYSEALRLVDRLPAARPLRLQLLMRVGNLYLRLKQMEEAARFYRAGLTAAINLGNKVAEGYMTLQLGVCTSGSAAAEALKRMQSARDLFASMGHNRGVAYALTNMGMVFQQNGQLPDALQLYTTAIDQSEQWWIWHDADDPFADCESALFTSPETAPYDRILDVLLQLGRTQEAFWYAERRIQRELFDLLTRVEPVTGDPATDELLSAWKHQRLLCAGGQRQLVTLYSSPIPGRAVLAVEVNAAIRHEGAELHRLSEEVTRVSPALAPAVRISSVGLAEVQKAVPPQSVLLFPVVADRMTAVFAVSSAGTSVQLSATGREAVANARREFLGVLQTRSALTDSEQLRSPLLEQRLRDAGRTLYEALLRPVEREISGAMKLLVVLPRELASVPVQALRKSPLKTDPYIAERFLVSYLPSVSFLFLPVPTPAPVKTVVALGCAGETSWDVEYELRDIRAFYKEVRLHFGQEATMTTLKEEKEDMLHLAVEVKVDDRAPGNSHIVLSDGKSAASTTRVPLGQLLELPAVGAVVISNLAEEQTTMHPAVPYVFLARTTGTLMMNTYVPARKTKKFFGEGLYTALLSGVTPEAAFRKAQGDMIRNPQYAAVHLWAPFSLWGK